MFDRVRNIPLKYGRDIKLFLTNVLPLYPLKTSENLWFSNVFGGKGGVSKWIIGLKCVNDWRVSVKKHIICTYL